MGMRAMQQPYGPALVIGGSILIGLLLLSATAALSGLTIFLVRRSRAVPEAARPAA
jgi:hypothetical protein